MLIALTRQHGIAGMSSGVSLICRLIEEQWSAVHPLLDADDDDDPTERINAINEMASIDGFIRVLWRVPLIQAPQVGQVTWRDYLLAEGRLNPVGDLAPIQKALIEAGFKAEQQSHLEHCTEQLAVALAQLARIDAVFDEKTPGYGPQLQALIDDLTLMSRPFNNELKMRAVALENSIATESAPKSDLASNKSAAERSSSAAISSRQDVIVMLQTICKFYSNNEPSSPVPILLRRAESLVNAEFTDIIKNLTPQAMEQIQFFVGPSSEN